MTLRYRQIAVMALVFMLGSLPVSAQGVEKFEDDTSSGALKVLFVGNSFTYNLPMIFSALAKAGNTRALKIHMAAFPSYSLSQHLSDTRTMTELERGGPWDYVVLQERSHFPVTQQKEMDSACVALDRKIRAAGARTVLLETWSDAAQPDAQATINQCFQTIGRKLGAKVIPAGEAWQRARATGKLYGTDNHHASPAGSFLVACSIYNALTGKDSRSVSSDIEEELGISKPLSAQLKAYAAGAGSSGVSSATSVRRPAGASQSSNTAAPQTNGVSSYSWKR